MVTPPRRELSFNAEINHDDAMLASSYSRALSVSYTAACSLVSRDIELLKSSLADAGEVTLGNLGTLRLEAETTVVFHHNESVLAGDGLLKINLAPVADEETTEQPTGEPVILEAPSRFSRTVHQVMRYAAMLILLLGVGIVLSTPLAVDNDNNNVVQASLNPLSLVAAEPEPEQIPELLIAQPAVDTQGTIAPIDNYCLVIASLANLDQARQFMAEAGDDAAGMFEADGRYRVYAVTGPDVASVRNEQLEDRNPGAWVCAMNR